MKCKNILNQKRELVAQSFGIKDQIYNSYSIGRSIGIKLKYVSLLLQHDVSIILLNE